MKKYLLLMGVLLSSLTSANASGLLGTKTQDAPQPPVKKAPAPPKNLHPYCCEPEAGPAMGITVSYLGGSYGPANMLIAADGVPTSNQSTPPSGSLVNVGLTWSSGVNVNFFYSQDGVDGPLIFADYRYVLGTNQTGGLSYPASATAPMISTFPLSADTGDTLRVYSATGRYDNSGAQTGTVLVGRSLLQKGSTSLFVASGASIYYINHHLNVHYSVNDGITPYQLYTLTQTEHRISGGPEIRLLARKSFGSCFGLDAMFGAYGHLGYFGNKGQEAYQVTTAGAVSYGYSTYGSLVRTIPGMEITLGGYYTFHMKDWGSLTLRASWDGGFEPTGTFITSPVVGTSALKPTQLGYALLNVGATYVF
jgi:hypothetical protein